jgi:hypothetical protein
MTACALLLGCAMLLWKSDGTDYLFRIAETMREQSVAVLVITVFGTAFWEDRLRKI